jgi:hypothetical protein
VSRRHSTAGLSGLVVATFLLCAAWAVTTSPLSGPDERAHMSSVVRLVGGGGWPLPYEATIEQAVRVAQYESGWPFPDIESIEVPPGERSPLSGGEVPEVAGRGIDNMVQHPPAAYVLAATAVRAVGGMDAPWDRALLAMRLVSAALMASAVAFAGVAVRAITGSGAAGLVGASAVVAIPLFTMLGGYVSNDPALIAASMAAIACVAVAGRSARPLPWLVLAGVAAGGALLAKGLAILMLPTLALAGVLAVWRTGGRPVRRVLMGLVPLGIALAVGGWWWVRNLLLLGTVQPSVLGDVQPRPIDDPYDLGFFLGAFVDRFNRLFWSRGARGAMALPEEVAIAAGVGLGIVLLVAFARRGTRLWLAVLAIYPLAIILTTALNAHRIYVTIGQPDRGVQGRYVFAGLIVVGLAVAVVAQLLGRRLPVVARNPAAACAPVLAVTVATGYLLWVLLGMGRPPIETGVRTAFRMSAEAMGVPAWTAPVLIVLALLAGGAGLLLLVGDRLRGRAVGEVTDGGVPTPGPGAAPPVTADGAAVEVPATSARPV